MGHPKDGFAAFPVLRRDLPGDAEGVFKIACDFPDGRTAVQEGPVFKVVVETPVIKIDGAHHSGFPSQRTCLAWIKPGVYS